MQVLDFVQKRGGPLLLLILLSVGIGAQKPAGAVPSYARQTGFACEACHTVFPELTPFGRRFKLNAYTLTTKQAISDVSQQMKSTLSLSDLPPLSVMLQASSTWWNQAPSGSPNATQSAAGIDARKAQNGDVQFPQQLSLFYAGKIADHFGAQIQATYSQSSGSFGIDNTDVRYSDHTADNKWVWGVTVNNNPSMQDVWNSTAAWGFPYFSPAGIAAPAAPLMTGLAQNSAGVGAYIFYDDSLYLEVSGYRSAKQGVAWNSVENIAVGGGTIDNVAPYWRLAYEKDWGSHSFELGASGMNIRWVPANTSSAAGDVSAMGLASSVTDWGLDAQYQYISDVNTFSLLAQYIHQNSSNNLNLVAPNGPAGASLYSNGTDKLDHTQVTATYYYNRWIGGSVAYTRINGSSDSLVYGGTGSPAAQFETFELDYLPWLNTKLLLQYTLYNRLDNNANAFVGLPNAKATDNNTTMVGLWVAF